LKPQKTDKHELWRVYPIVAIIPALVALHLILRGIPLDQIQQRLVRTPIWTLLLMLFLSMATLITEMWFARRHYNSLELEDAYDPKLQLIANVLQTNIGSIFINIKRFFTRNLGAIGLVQEKQAAMHLVIASGGWLVLGLVSIFAEKIAPFGHLSTILTTLFALIVFVLSFHKIDSTPLVTIQKCLTFTMRGILFAIIAIGVLRVSAGNFGLALTSYGLAVFAATTLAAPGQWLVFDLLAIAGLAQHKSFASAATVVLLYRIANNFFPLLLTLIDAMIVFSQRIDASLQNLPSQSLKHVCHKISAWLLYLLGFLMVIWSAAPSIFYIFQATISFNPQAAFYTNSTHLGGIIFGFASIMIARGLLNKVKRTLPLAIGIILIDFIYATMFYNDYLIMMMLVISGMMLLYSRENLYRTQIKYAWENLATDFGVSLVLLFAFFAIRTIRFQSTQVTTTVNHDAFHYRMIMLTVTFLLIALIAIVIPYYLTKPNIVLGQKVDEDQVKAIAAISDNHFTNLIWLGDKRTFTFEHAVLFQFRIKGAKAIVMGDPIGDSSLFPLALAALVHEADQLNYQLVFYEISKDLALRVHEYGYDFIKLGEEGLVDPNSFSLSGKKKSIKNLRSLQNQIDKSGYTFEVLDPPFAHEEFKQFETISTNWLHGRSEAGFSLGFYDEDYVSRGDIAVLRDTNSDIVAFATLVYSHSENALAVDLMRFGDDAPKGTMDVMFVKIINYAKEQGYATFNMGMSPLAEVGLQRDAFLREKIGNLIYRFGTPIYSFDGLRRYKSKFATDWQPLYISYSRKSNILLTFLALLLIDNKGD
jgi:phosphatidylglycerol lysyltransferase